MHVQSHILVIKPIAFLTFLYDAVAVVVAKAP